MHLSSPAELPRFNMPFECGVFYGALRYGAAAQRRKRFLLLDREPYQYQKTMSDAAELDPRVHGNDPNTLIACIRDFLAEGLDPKPVGPARISALYTQFQEALPVITAKANLTLADIEPLTAFNDCICLQAHGCNNKPPCPPELGGVSSHKLDWRTSVVTIKFSVPDRVKKEFDRIFNDQNKSSVIARLMQRAVRHAEGNYLVASCSTN